MTLYQERLYPAPSMFVFIALVIPASIVVFIPIKPQGGITGLGVGVMVGLVLYLGVIALFVVTAPKITVSSNVLTVGRATIPREFVGDIQSYRGDAATVQRGTALDARAWLCIRGWVKPVLRISIVDPNDPTPYWLISTRRPDALERLLSSPHPADVNSPAPKENLP